ncbi:uncharacterized protein C8Q71DRAFT_393736 [Rhodofomes roseus]|uniref:Chitin-binding type-2 domain-containing protein n=1 Tax=Rhodofomes roseus TaxID=34475 RepID=A0ABQ8K0F4_9APHY|nr:uncharacterized protein C8Q71DRAFT_393736 [Rhodofomes roseus]KAH9829900.1 hypothetical protein C8Q71DRAFT_393736 [Rhodofomes roseus]
MGMMRVLQRVGRCAHNAPVISKLAEAEKAHVRRSLDTRSGDSPSHSVNTRSASAFIPRQRDPGHSSATQVAVHHSGDERDDVRCAEANVARVRSTAGATGTDATRGAGTAGCTALLRCVRARCSGAARGRSSAVSVLAAASVSQCEQAQGQRRCTYVQSVPSLPFPSNRALLATGQPDRRMRRVVPCTDAIGRHRISGCGHRLTCCVLTSGPCNGGTYSPPRTPCTREREVCLRTREFPANAHRTCAAPSPSVELCPRSSPPVESS